MGNSGNIGANMSGTLTGQDTRVANRFGMQQRHMGMIEQEKAANAPLEREHMAKMWADEDTQRHQEQTQRELGNQRAGWEFKREQQFPGNPLGPHWAQTVNQITSEPNNWTSVPKMGPDGKPMLDAKGQPMTTMQLKPEAHQLLGQSYKEWLGQSGQMPSVTSQDNNAPKPPIVPHKDAGAVKTFMSGALPIVMQGGLAGLAQKIPNRGLRGAATIGSLMMNRPLSAATDWTMGVTDEDRAAHPTADKWGTMAGVTAGLGLGLTSKGEGMSKMKAMTNRLRGRPAGITPSVEGERMGVNAVREGAQQGPYKPGAMKPKGWYQQGGQTAETVQPASIGAKMTSGMEEAGKPLQGTVPQSANGPATMNPALGGKAAGTTASPQAAQANRTPGYNQNLPKGVKVNVSSRHADLRQAMIKAGFPPEVVQGMSEADLLAFAKRYNPVTQ
jgi:hypothetical protein